MMWVESGITTRQVGFRRQAGLSGFTVYRSRDGAAAVQMTAPTVTERAVGDSESFYWLLLDEDMTVAAGNSTEHMLFQVTATGMQTAIIEVLLYNPVAFDVNAAYLNGTQVVGTGAVADKWRGPSV